MADPLSIIAGAVGITDVCVRVGKYLRDVRNIAKHADQVIQNLELEIRNFKNIYNTLADLSKTTSHQKLQTPSYERDESARKTSWAEASDLIQEGHKLVLELQDILSSILGDGSTPKRSLDDWRKATKLLSKNSEYERIRGRMTCLNVGLNLMIGAIHLTSHDVFSANTDLTLEQLPGRLAEKLQGDGLVLRAQIETAEQRDGNLESSISSAKAAITFASLNEHFYVQRSDTSIWTGRKRYLDQLKNSLLSVSTVGRQMQKRFVIHGIPGAGKTQLCCKFAQEYRESFWGIFWVDATNKHTASESWKRIAKISGREPNEEAGKHWLSNLQSPWLLIIDNANDSEDSIQAQFPTGERGCVLITTRNPRVSIHASVGPPLRLDRFDKEEADDLLRKATNHEPWDSHAKESASSIAQHLDYLPLALIHAGRAIFHRLCTLQGYIPFFNRALDTFNSIKPSNLVVEDDGLGAGPFMSFDIIYSGIEAQSIRNTVSARVAKDAIEIINVFAFFNSNDICLDILIKAGRNLHMTPEVQKKQSVDKTSSSSLMSLANWQNLRHWLMSKVVSIQRQSLTLPHLFRQDVDEDFDESRARRAIDLLVRWSLIEESSERGTYSMHPLVHVWLRKRLSTAAQALWCDIAGNVLASSIKLPPLVDDQDDQSFRLRILRHVTEVQKLKDDVSDQLKNNRRSSLLGNWMPFESESSFTSSEAQKCARFSRVYMECGLFDQSSSLQHVVLQYIDSRLGCSHPLSIQVQIALSKSLWHLGHAAQAQEIQEGALRCCQTTFGATNAQTLRVMADLAGTYWQRGLLAESRELHEAAIEGMKGDPSMRRDYFNAINYLGAVHYWCLNFETAQDLQRQAFEGLADEFGEDDADALVAKSALAMSLLQLGGHENTRKAHKTAQEVYKLRQQKLGKEHLYSLWSACDFARSCAALGALERDQQLIDQAKAIFQEGLPIAHRNLGTNHVGTLMGRQHHADVLVLERQFDEAEAEYKDIAERLRNAPGAHEGRHRDRFYTLRKLVECHELQHRPEDALSVCDTLLNELGEGIGEGDHPWRSRVLQKRDQLIAAQQPRTVHDE